MKYSDEDLIKVRRLLGQESNLLLQIVVDLMSISLGVFFVYVLYKRGTTVDKNIAEGFGAMILLYAANLRYKYRAIAAINLLEKSDNENAIKCKKVDMVYIFGFGMLFAISLIAVLFIKSKPHNPKEFISTNYIDLIAYPLFGCLAGYLLWGAITEYNRGAGKEKHENTQNPRTPRYNVYYLAATICISLLGLVLIFGDILFFKTPIQDYIMPMLFVGLLMFMQLLIYRKFEEDEYLKLINVPRPAFSFEQLLRRRWPVWIIGGFAIPLWKFKAVGAFLFLFIMYFPWQRRLFIRSQEEFKRDPPRSN